MVEPGLVLRRGVVQAADLVDVGGVVVTTAGEGSAREADDSNRSKKNFLRMLFSSPFRKV